MRRFRVRPVGAAGAAAGFGGVGAGAGAGAGAAAAANTHFAFLLALQMAAKQGIPKRGPLDYVSIAEYALGWKEHGARIGHYEAGKIVWHD